MFILNPTSEGNRTPWVVNPVPDLNVTAKIQLFLQYRVLNRQIILNSFVIPSIVLNNEQ